MKNETKTIKYLYVDDNDKGKESVQCFLTPKELPTDVVEPKENLELPTDVIEPKENFVLSIDVIKPTEKRKDIFKMLTDYDGLMVDQQLDEKPNSDGNISDYLGSSLASDIRVMEGGKKLNGIDASMPIILFSANPNVPSSLYSLGEEIFDVKIYKTDNKYWDFAQKVPTYKKQMISLVNGYKQLKELKSDVFGCLGIGENLDKIDSRFLDELKRRDDRTAHSKASFILNELIIKQGILVDEEILAVRLGVDKKESKENWNAVLADLKEFGAEYQGVFCDGWPRWWMPMVDEWWYQLEGNETYIRFYSAEKRAKLIEEKLNEKLSEKIQLVPAKAKTKYSVHTDYWTICDEFKEPLDIEDGLMRPNQENLYPWQDASYVSIQAAKGGAEVAECEKERLKMIKGI